MPRVLAGPIDAMSLRVREFVVAIPKPGAMIPMLSGSVITIS
jgi:hypothetical protein